MLIKCGFIFSAVVFSLLCAEVKSNFTFVNISKPRTNPADWWQNGVFYQIYLRSFKDSNNDGIGDLKGLTGKLEDLHKTGITAICLSQIFKSPGKEHSQDISNFNEIHSDYGEMKDFENMIDEAKKDNVEIKIILDFVINHSSKKHDWFVKSEKKTTGYEDFYVWRPGKDGENGNVPPNNWLSVYGDSAWTFSSIRKQFYLHQFSENQPDLNYANAEVKKKIKDVLKFWFDKGIDGFRIPAVPFLFEDDKFEDEPRSHLPNISDYEHQYLQHIYTMDQDKTFDFIYELREFIDVYNKESNIGYPKILMSEAYTSIENTMRYYGEKNRNGAHVSFNFQLIPHNRDSNAFQIVKSINEWLNKIPNGQIANWVVGNHDNHRVATRFRPELVNNINILIASLPGVMFTYSGEEIGQEDGEVTYIQCKDPIGCKAGPADFLKISRDFERTPFHWNNEPNAGFTGPEVDPWLPISKEQVKKTNLKDQMGKTGSPFEIYKHIISKVVRNSDAFVRANVKVEAVSENIIKVTRGSDSGDYGNYEVLINNGKSKEKLKVAGNKKGLYYEVIYSTDASYRPKLKVWEKDITVGASKALILKVISKDYIIYDWWKHAVIYQIYPRSFKDEDNDGFGDLKGIISKLEYLKGLGVDAICLSSIYKSPQKDLGYDISDFKNIDRSYGNLEDFEQLIRIADAQGIKVIMDFVPNHSSREHEWFKAALLGDLEKKKFYVWGTSKNKNPPNNWLSIYRGEAWTENPHTPKEYYLHQFNSNQPDLNYENPNVIKEMQAILKTWLQRGVAGFRIIGAPYLFENKDIENEPPSNDPAGEKGKWKSLRHVYTSDKPKTFDMIYTWREYMDKYTAEAGGHERIIITEANTDIHNTMYYYGNNDKKGAHLTFNFQLIETVNGTSNANDFAGKINEWIDHIPEGYTSNWVLGNHDKRRVATRFGPENVDGFNMLTAILPGVMVTYNGEEIGQEDTVLELDYCVGDPVFCPATGQKEGLEELSKLRRDRQRTPFHWDSSTNAGFNTGKLPWLHVSNDYVKTNLALQVNNSSSHYELYKRLIKLRQEPAFVRGSLKVKAVTDYVLTSLRYDTPIVSYFHLFNLGKNQESFNLKTAYNEVTPNLKVVETNDPERLPMGTVLDVNNITLQAHESVIAVFFVQESPSSAKIYIASSFLLFSSVFINIISFN